MSYNYIEPKISTIEPDQRCSTSKDAGPIIVKGHYDGDFDERFNVFLEQKGDSDDLIYLTPSQVNELIDQLSEIRSYFAVQVARREFRRMTSFGQLYKDRRNIIYKVTGFFTEHDTNDVLITFEHVNSGASYILSRSKFEDGRFTRVE